MCSELESCVEIHSKPLYSLSDEPKYVTSDSDPCQGKPSAQIGLVASSEGYHLVPKVVKHYMVPLTPLYCLDFCCSQTLAQFLD